MVIYLVTNEVNGKRYAGQTVRPLLKSGENLRW